MLGHCRRRSPKCSRWSCETCGPARSGVLQLAVPGGGGGGTWQPVINLSALNGFVTLTKFQMETVASVLGFIQKGYWMFSIDFKDAYFQIPVHPESLPFLRFCLEGWVYQFCPLYFGVSTAPQLFTRVFVLFSEWAHRRDVHLLRYLDSWLVIAESHTLQLLQDQSVGSEWLRHADEVSDGNRDVCVGVYPEGVLDVLNRLQGCLLPDSCTSGISAVSTVLSLGMGLPVLSLVFRCVHSPTVVHQSLRSVFGMGAPEGRVSTLLSGQLAGHC